MRSVFLWVGSKDWGGCSKKDDDDNDEEDDDGDDDDDRVSMICGLDGWVEGKGGREVALCRVKDLFLVAAFKVSYVLQLRLIEYRLVWVYFNVIKLR